MSRGVLLRTVTHWTGGGGRASAPDKKHYHYITEFDGRRVKGKEEPEDNIVVSDGDYAAHTLRLNTGSIGVAMAAMAGAKEQPLDYGSSPITEVQFERHCALLAELHIEHGIPVTPSTCLTHAEVEPRLGVKQRGKWDITVLKFRPDLRGALRIGDYMRERVRFYMGELRGEPVEEVEDPPILRVGRRGLFVQDLQLQLADAGYFTGKDDGIFGPRTRGAVLEFQADHGLTVDGVVGPQTWSALARAGKRQVREVDEAELRAASRSGQAAKKGENALTMAEVSAYATAGVAGIGEFNAIAGQAEGALQTAQRLLADNWQVLLLLAAVVLAARYGKAILREMWGYRFEDARNGEHLGR
ncbi:MAG: peptidoglycan-binding domain-containing protein [Pseudomonadota bacterium]